MASSLVATATLPILAWSADLSKSGRCLAAGAQYADGTCASSGLSLTERIINRFSHPFFSQVCVWQS